MTGKAERIEVPEAVRALDVLTGPDYMFACRLADPDAATRSAEQWARAVFEQAPLVFRWFLLVGWIGVLRLRLAPRRSPDHVSGWEIVSSTPTEIVLGSQSSAMTNRLVVRVDGAEVVHATFIRFERRIGAILWAAAGPIHQLTVPYLLARAARYFERSGAGPV